MFSAFRTATRSGQDEGTTAGREKSMKRWMVIVAALTVGALNSWAGVKAGDAAPDVSATGSEGKAVKLADFKGKYVVLEWTNPGCPVVKRHYDGGNMQSVQKAATGKGAVWLTVATGPAAKADYKKRASDTGAAWSDVLLDSDGAVGKAFGAKTTPHMFVVGPEGKVIYTGAIDDGNEDTKAAQNYVLAAIEEATAGKPVSKADTKPYGCGVKYP